MSRIKKRGLDYFPLNTDFIQNRIVRRIMKRNGDGALATLLGALSCIYADEGYYVHADELFYEDLSAGLYETTTAKAKSILALAVDYGFFSPAVFQKYGILTSAEIQRQYLFSTKRRKSSAIDPRFCLIDDAQTDIEGNAGDCKAANADAQAETDANAHEYAVAERLAGGGSVTLKPQNVTSGTHSIAQHSTEKHSVAQESKENPLLNSSPEIGGTEGADGASAGEGTFCGREEKSSSAAESAPARKEGGTVPKEGGTAPKEGGTARRTTRAAVRREWTEEDICNLRPPQDGLKRNLDGLILNLRHCRISPQEQYAIILKSNFGVIGHPLWKGFYALRDSHGKIRQPGRYLLSLCNK